MRTERFKGALLSTLVIVALMALAMATISLPSAGPVSAEGPIPRNWYVKTPGLGSMSGNCWENAMGTIENAITNASPNDTIIVGDGTYPENLKVDKENLTIRSENGAAITIVQTPYSDVYVFEVTASGVSIIGFTVENATGSDKAGVFLSGSDNCDISNNICSNNSDYGIHLVGSSNNTIENNICSNNSDYGIHLWNSSNYNTLSSNTCRNNWRGISLGSWSNYNILENNTCSNNSYGICLGVSSSNTLSNNIARNNGDGIDIFYSDNNTLTNNTCENNWLGIYLRASSNNTLTNNTCENNRYNFNVECLSVGDPDISHFDHDIDTSNLVDGRPIYYLRDNSDLVIGPSLNPGYLGLVRCDNIRVENLVLENNGQGILLASTENSRIENCAFSNNFDGILLSDSSGNTLSSNTCENNWRGIRLYYSSSNTISNNTVSNNPGHGIYLDFSSSNTLSNNTCSGNNYDGILLSVSSSNTLSSNTCENNNRGIWLVNSSDYNTLSNNTCSNNGNGIILGSSSYNILSNNTCSNNDYAIYLESDNNLIYHNNLISNANQAYDDGVNYWDNGYPSGGNYWSDYAGVDENRGENQDIPGSDGIGDTPYNIPGDNNQDRYPLMYPYLPAEIIVRGKDTAYSINQAGALPWLVYNQGDRPLIMVAMRVGSGGVVAAGTASTCRDGRWNDPNNPYPHYDALLDVAFQWMVPGATKVLWYEGYNVYNNTGQCSELVAALDALGYTITGDSTEPITSSLLSPYDILVIPQLQLGTSGTGGDPGLLPDADVQAIKSFVEGGGGLLIMESGDFGGYNYPKVQNKILAGLDFGYYFQDDSVVDRENNWGADYLPICDVSTATNIGSTCENATGENEIGPYSICSMAKAGPGVSLYVLPDYQVGMPGATLEYAIIVSNPENPLAENLTYNILADDNADWGLSLENSSLFVPIGEYRETTLSVAIPADTPLSNEDTIVVTAVASEHPDVQTSFTTIAHAGKRIEPFDDVYVSDQDSDANYSGENSLRVGRYYEYWQWPYLKFDLSEIPSEANITDARLYLYAYYEYASGFDVLCHEVEDDIWTEATITWNTKPTPGALLDTKFVDYASRDSPKSYSWDVTSFVANEFAGDQWVSFCLRPPDDLPESITRAFWSKERYENRVHPFLRISYTTEVVEEKEVMYPIADVYAFGDENGYSRSQLKFDISGIPSGAGIISAKLWLYRLAADDWDGDVALNRVEDQAWDETVTASEFDAQTLTDEENRAGKFTSHGWDYLNVLNQLEVDQGVGHAHTSFRLRWVNDDGGEPSVCIDDNRFLVINSEVDELSIVFCSSEYDGNDPYLKVTYIMPYAVSASISPSYKSGSPGETLSYSVTITNTGNLDDTYDLTVSDNLGWGPMVAPISITIPAGSSGTATLYVTIPVDAENGAEDHITVTATSTTDPTVSDSASCTARAIALRRVEVSISPENQSGAPGETLTYTVTVKNTGNVTDNYDLTADDNTNWSLTLPETLTDIIPSESRTVNLGVGIPGNAENCTRDNVTVTVSSRTDNTVESSASCIAHAVVPEVQRWDALITATFPLGIDDAIFGVRQDATAGFDSAYDLPEPPPPIEPPYVQAFFHYPGNAPLPTRLHRSYIPPEDLMEWPLRVSYRDGMDNITLSWNLENVPTDYAVLLLKGGNLVADMRAVDNYTFEAASGDHDFKVIVGVLVPFTLELTHGWNMISFPVLPENSSPDAIFGSYYVLYTWDAENNRYVLHADSGNYIEPDPDVEAGVGYWAYVLEDENVTLVGVPVTQLTLSLRQGWNLIGPPYGGSSIADPADDPENSVIAWAFTWNANEKRYSMTQFLEAGKGYWAYAVRDCTLMLGPTAGAPATISLSEVGGIGFADGIPTYSGIENIYIMQHKSNSYDNTVNLSGHENLQVWGGNTAVIEDIGLPAENVPYENLFDIVVAVKGHTNNMAYVNKENMYVRIVISNAFSDDEDTLTTGKRYDFEDGTPTYIRTNHLFDNDGNGYKLGAGENIDLTVYYYCYK